MNKSMIMLAGVMVALGVWGLRRAQRARGDEASDLTVGAAWGLCLLALVVRLTGIMLLQRVGFITFTLDETARLRIAAGWAAHPYWFGSGDGIWLVGGFIFYGLPMRLMGDPATGLVLGALAGNVLALAGAYALGRVAGGRRWLGATAALMLAVAYPQLWFGPGPLVENPLTGCYLLGLAAAWRFLQAEERPRGLGLAVQAGLWWFAAASMHYIGWMAIAATVPVGLGVLWKMRGRLGRRDWLGVGLIWGVPALFPLLWMIGSWVRLGHPLQFLHNQAGLLKYYMDTLGYEQGTRSRLSIYPQYLRMELGPLLGLVAAGMLGMAWGRAPERRGLRLLGLVWMTLLGIMVASAWRSGYGVPWRSLVILHALLLVFGVVTLGGLEGYLTTRYRMNGPKLACLLLLAAAAAGWVQFNARIARDYETYSGNELPHELYQLGEWLRQEINRPWVLGDFNAGSLLAVHSTKLPEHFLPVVGYVTGEPQHFTYPRTLAAGDLAGVTYVICDDARFMGGREVANLGLWHVYER